MISFTLLSHVPLAAWQIRKCKRKRVILTRECVMESYSHLLVSVAVSPESHQLVACAVSPLPARIMPHKSDYHGC